MENCTARSAPYTQQTEDASPANRVAARRSRYTQGTTQGRAGSCWAVLRARRRSTTALLDTIHPMQPWMLIAFPHDESAFLDVAMAKAWNRDNYTDRRNRFRSASASVRASGRLAGVVGAAGMIVLKSLERAHFPPDAEEFNAYLDERYRAAAAKPAGTQPTPFGEVFRWEGGVELTVGPPEVVDSFGTRGVACSATLRNGASPLSGHSVIACARSGGAELDILYTGNELDGFAGDIGPREQVEFTVAFKASSALGLEVEVALGVQPEVALFRSDTNGAAVPRLILAEAAEEFVEPEILDLYEAMYGVGGFFPPVRPFRSVAIRDIIGRPSRQGFLVVTDQDGAALAPDAEGLVHVASFVVTNYPSQLSWEEGDYAHELEQLKAADLNELYQVISYFKSGGTQIIP